ncbi:DUF4270 domain-containing protein [Lacinutrix cladophorae]
MKNKIKALKLIGLFALIALAFVACDKDFTSLESDIEGSQNFNTDSAYQFVLTYNKKINPVQTNGLSANLLGVYKDDIYGKTTASVVSQVTLNSYDPDFGTSPELVSVILSIPYFSTLEETVDGVSTYSMTEKDSLYGSEDAPIKLTINRNGYFLRDFDPDNIEEFQKYYSNANSTINFDNYIVETLYETDGSLEKPHFYPSIEEIIINEDTDDEETLTPRFRQELDMPEGYWENLFFEKQDMAELSNENNFQNYFRGLYIKAEAVNDKGSLLLLDFSNAMIELNYTKHQVVNSVVVTDDDGNIVKEEETLQINLSGNILNILESDDPDNTITTAAEGANLVDGDESLYLKGGEGAMAVIDLFGGPDSDNDGFSDAYDDFIDTYKDQRLINEANLVFYVDETATASLSEMQKPSRVIIYDLKNNVPIVDYFLDITNTTTPEESKTFHSTPLDKESEDNGKYKIRLTEHLNNILLRDSTNLQLGLMVTTNINEVFQFTTSDSEDIITSGTVMSPKGTVLHGGNENVPLEKRVQLEIFYTEPKN